MKNYLSEIETEERMDDLRELMVEKGGGLNVGSPS